MGNEQAQVTLSLNLRQTGDPYTAKTEIVTINLPSDPKDPSRKNENAPVDIPKEEEYQKQNTPEKKHEEYKNSFYNW